MKRRWLHIAVLASLLVPISSAVVAQETTGIQTLLDERVAAVVEGDEDRFIATLDPSQPEFVERQRLLFKGMHSLDISGYSLKVELEDLPDLVREVDHDKYKAPVSIRWVKEHFSLDGFDQERAINDLFFTFVKRPKGWLIASDTDVEDLGLLSSRTIWDFGEVATHASEHFLVLSHPDFADKAKELPGIAEKALARVGKAWNGEWIKKVPLVVPSSSAELDRMTGGTVDVDKFVAFASYSVERDVPDLYQAVGYRVVVNPARFFSSSAELTLAHELVHIATRPASGPLIPIFLDEGLAQLSEIGDVAAVTRRAKSVGDGDLPEDHEFVSGTQRSINSAYDEALSAMLFLRELKGPGSVEALYRALGKAQGLGGTAEYHLDRALRETTGMSLGAFEEAWKKW